MRNYHQDYFCMLTDGANTPRLSFDKNQIEDTHMLFADHPLDENYVVSFKFGFPVPKNPEMGDLLEKAQHLVISDKIKELLQPMKLKNIQFLPTEIRNPNNDDEYTGYWVLHIHNLIECMNLEESTYDTIKGRVSKIEKLVFNHAALEKVPLEERLIFALGEQNLSMFFHRSIVAQTIALQPNNVRFHCMATREEVEEPFDDALLPYLLFPVIKEKKEPVKSKSILEILQEAKDRVKASKKQ